MGQRQFIQETIDTLEKAKNRVEEYWTKFKNGEIDKQTF